MEFQGQIYHVGNRMQTEHARSFFQTLAMRDKVVLDCGCGDGRALTEFCAGQTLKQLYGFDPSTSQVAVAQEKYGNVGSFFVGDFDNFLQVPGGLGLQGKIDIVISSFALHLAPSRANAFKNIYAALKPGGEFHAVYPTHCSFLSRMLRELEDDERFGKYISQKPIHEKNPNGVLLGNEETEQYPTHTICTFKLLLGAGFSYQTIRVSERVQVMQFENSAEVERFVAGINLHRNLIPEELRAEFDKCAALELRKTPYFFGPDRLHLVSPAIELHAYKDKTETTETQVSDESFVE